MTEEQFNQIITLLKEIKDGLPDTFDIDQIKDTVDDIETKVDSIQKTVETLSNSN